MALTIGDNFSYMGAKPLDGRLKYDTVASMKAMADSVLYDGCLAYCVATDKTYQWKSTNDVDATLGRWREFETGAAITVDGEIDDTSENPVQNKVIAAALNDKADLVDSKVPAAQLPSFVDDVLEYEDQAHFPASGESGKIYVALDTNKTYRWSGSAYVEISESLALGETSSTAYRGDRGKTAYDDSQANKAAIGDLSELETTDKSDLVSAINEVVGSGGAQYTAGDGIVIENDEISTNNMPAADIDEVASPMPSVMSRRFKYSTEEQIVGEWIDGKPLYQKVISLPSGISPFEANTWTDVINVNIPIDTMVFSRVISGDNNAPSDCNFISLNYNVSTHYIRALHTRNISLTVYNNSYIILQYTKTTD